MHKINELTIPYHSFDTFLNHFNSTPDALSLKDSQKQSIIYYFISYLVNESNEDNAKKIEFLIHHPDFDMLQKDIRENTPLAFLKYTCSIQDVAFEHRLLSQFIQIHEKQQLEKDMKTNLNKASHKIKI